ncbi:MULTISPECIES: hypothetical protein [Pseudomonas syringae group]|uniref:hypothetical protein n=1 Tax=Pseudomonas syringae group TaxID=136849 RepID=UPI001F0D4D19|nr:MULTISPECIES: hypothetical protein [Pseudomonas syringae group]MCH5536742.1 hypothetical protein [Pseudomonas syringae pv. syringae]MDF5774781.1 hypothetical protein [Pseudomonas syringae pv. syringae]MDU8608711.1 hypothetical protein [Pseudomonas syringae group sp. 247E2]
MNRLRRMLNRAFAIPSTNQALVAVAACPALYAVACTQTPQISEYLNGLGIHVSMMQVFIAGSTAYCVMLRRHRVFNNRYFVRYAAEIERHRQLTTACQSLITMGLTETAEYQAVAYERDGISDRLGFLIDADNFYRKLNGLADLIRERLHHLMQMSR